MLFPLWGFYKRYCYEYFCTCHLRNIHSSFGYIELGRNVGAVDMPMFLSIYCKQYSQVIYISSKIYESSICSTSLLIHGIICLYYFSHLFGYHSFYVHSFKNILGSSKLKTSVHQRSLSKEKRQPMEWENLQITYLMD